MKALLQNDLIHPALFRIAAFIENPIAPQFFESAPVITEKAFASLRSEVAKSKTVEYKNGSAANTQINGISKRHATQNASPKNGVTHKRISHSSANLKPAEFHLKAPSDNS